jgi:hypothetical protein
MEENKEQQYLTQLKDIVMRQTDYSEDQALEKIKEHNKDITSIVREFMGGSKAAINNNKSVNQTIYSEIRSFMDTAAATYNAKKEAEERQKQRHQMYIEQVKREVERRKQAAVATTSDVYTTSDVNTTPKGC